MRVGFTGAQKGMTTLQYSMVTKILTMYEEQIQEIHHGDCIGADKEFHDIGTKIGITSVLHPPKNATKRAFCKADKTLPAKEYLDRNHDIVDDTDLLIATPSGMVNVLRSGTWSTIRYSKRKRNKTIIIYPDGKTKY